MLHVGEFVAGVLDLDVSRTDAGDPRAANLAVAKRIEQNHKSRKVERMLRFDTFKSNLILELA